MKDSIQAQQGEMLRRVTYDPQKDSNRYKVRKRSKQKSRSPPIPPGTVRAIEEAYAEKSLSIAPSTKPQKRIPDTSTVLRKKKIPASSEDEGDWRTPLSTGVDERIYRTVSNAVLDAAATSAQERLSRALIEDKVVKEAKVYAAASKKVLGVVNTSAGRKVEKCGERRI